MNDSIRRRAGVALLALTGGVAVAAPASVASTPAVAHASEAGTPDNDLVKLLKTLRCLSLHRLGVETVGEMEQANDDMEEAWNGGGAIDAGAHTEARDDYDEAHNEWGAANGEWNGLGCTGLTHRSFPAAPERWSPGSD